MTSYNDTRYLLDANVLMTAYHHYYAPELCPGFWEFLEHYIAVGRMVIIDRVYDEILFPSGLVAWSERAVNAVPVSTASQPVAESYRRLMDWVQENPQFNPAARRDFANGADGWLAAYSMVSGAVVVTNESSAPNAAKRVPLPDLCEQFGVPYISPFRMLLDLGARFVWEPA